MKISSKAKRLSLGIFFSLLEKSHGPSNRWCQPVNSMLWDKVEHRYNSCPNNDARDMSERLIDTLCALSGRHKLVMYPKQVRKIILKKGRLLI